MGEFPLLLAPMEDVSDPPFRAVCKINGADLMYSEFISSEGLIRDAIKSRQKLDIFDYERPVGIQIFGGDEEPMAMAAQIVGDIIFAEPKALIGFAGPRVVQAAVKIELPEGFQTSEFLLKHGFVDRIVARPDLRSEIARTIDYCGK